MAKRFLAVGLTATLLSAASLSSAAIVDPGFQESAFASVSAQITGMAWAPDGTERLFVLRKQGEIHIVEAGVPLATPFATISPIVTASECGLIGIAFDPDFIQNGYVYVFATVSKTEQQIIRYRANGNIGEEQTVLIAGLPTGGVNHDGGALGFGPDAKLYWAIGDNGPQRVGVGDDLLSLAAKIGRANRDGSAAADNPFVDGDGPNNDYIWARGFRNPFTMTFQPATDRLWLNVVGSVYEQIFTPRAGDNAGWSSYENTQPDGFLPPVIAYRTNAELVSQIVPTGAVRVNGRVTLTTQAAVRFRPGAKLLVTGVTDPTFDGTVYVASVDSATSFSYLQAGADAASGGGTATAEMIGGAITGGTFWDSSAVPAADRGSFSWGDYNTGRIMRARLGAQNEVVAIDEWANGRDRLVDSALGPDGDLYYVELRGGIFHASYVATSQALVVSRLNVRMLEGGRAAFNVRLAMPPAGNARTKVGVKVLAGDPDVSLIEGTSLAFDAGNWSKPQRVVLAAAGDADSLDDAATVRVAASGLTPELVTVRVTNENSSAGSAAGGAGNEAVAGAPSDAVAGAASEAAAGVPNQAVAGAESAAGGAAPSSASGGVDATGHAGAGSNEAGAADGVVEPRGQQSGCGCGVAGGAGSSLVPWGLLVSGGLLLRRRRALRA